MKINQSWLIERECDKIKKEHTFEKWGRCSKLRKSEKLKKIQLLLNQKNLYEDQYERLLAATGDWKSNYTDYLITEPIDLVEELKRVPEADYELCTALLTMLVKEEIPENASDKTFVDHKGFLILERMNEILSAGAREDESGRYSLSCGIKQICS